MASPQLTASWYEQQSPQVREAIARYLATRSGRRVTRHAGEGAPEEFVAWLAVAESLSQHRRGTSLFPGARTPWRQRYAAGLSPQQALDADATR